MRISSLSLSISNLSTHISPLLPLSISTFSLYFQFLLSYFSTFSLYLHFVLSLSPLSLSISTFNSLIIIISWLSKENAFVQYATVVNISVHLWRTATWANPSINPSLNQFTRKTSWERRVWKVQILIMESIRTRRWMSIRWINSQWITAISPSLTRSIIWVTQILSLNKHMSIIRVKLVDRTTVVISWSGVALHINLLRDTQVVRQLTPCPSWDRPPTTKITTKCKHVHLRSPATTMILLRSSHPSLFSALLRVMNTISLTITQIELLNARQEMSFSLEHPPSKDNISHSRRRNTFNSKTYVLLTF